MTLQVTFTRYAKDAAGAPHAEVITWQTVEPGDDRAISTVVLRADSGQPLAGVDDHEHWLWVAASDPLWTHDPNGPFVTKPYVKPLQAGMVIQTKAQYDTLVAAVLKKQSDAEAAELAAWVKNNVKGKG